MVEEITVFSALYDSLFNAINAFLEAASSLHVVLYLVEIVDLDHAHVKVRLDSFANLACLLKPEHSLNVLLGFCLNNPLANLEIVLVFWV